MKMHRVVLLLLVVSLIALQGCSVSGTWLSNSHRPVNTLNHWDWGHGSTMVDPWTYGHGHHALNHYHHAHLTTINTETLSE